MQSPMDGQARATAINDLELILLDETAEPRALPLLLLEAITNGFSEDRAIGRGGFAVVYRGILENGTFVAVKRLSQHIDENKFMREVECLMKAKHKNIVRFLGYCAESQGNIMSHNGKLVMADAQQRLLCFEYLSKGSLRDYITDESCKLEWRQCYQIIKGICQGLHYLHENHIVHLDLKPENILLDDHMVPKIADFGLSRCFEEKQTSQSITSKLSGTLGYIAPELYVGAKITLKSDIYSLGIIILEILTGQRGYPDVEAVVEGWRARLVEDTQFEQVRLCTDIGIECSEFNPEKRPDSTQTIIKRLQETEPADEVYGLSVHPRILYFPCAPITLLPSSLYLTNNTDEHLAFRLIENAKIHVKCCFENMPLYGIVAPRSVYSVVVSTDKPKEKFVDLILESCTLGDAHTLEIPSKSLLHELFEETKNVDNMVQKVTLKVVATAQPEMITSELIPPGMKILRDQKTENVGEAICFDVNPTKEWMITGHLLGFVRIWNCQTERKMHSFKVSNRIVTSVKFVERMKWFVASSYDRVIHIYNYETKVHKIASFRGGPIVAVHPTKPYLLSASYYPGRDVVDLFCWDRDWECTQIFEIDHSGKPSHIAFNPEDPDTFAIAFKEHTVIEVWTIDCSISKYKLMCGHIGDVNCLEFFTHDDRQYLISVSNNCRAKIWDMQKYVCIYTLETSWCRIMSVLLPNRQIIITGSTKGTVYLWISTNFRPQRIINTCASSGGLWGLAYFMRSNGVLIIGRENTTTMTDMDSSNCKEESRHSSKPQFVADMKPEDITFQMIPTDSALLDVYPLELPILSRRHRTVHMMHLTNKTDEHVAFRLQLHTADPCFRYEQPRCGIIPPRCLYSLVMVAKRLTRSLINEGRAKEKKLLLRSIVSGDRCIVPLVHERDYDKLFQELIETGNPVHEVALRGFSYRQAEDEIVFNNSCDDSILDAHPTKIWVLTTGMFSSRVAIKAVLREESEDDWEMHNSKVDTDDSEVKIERRDVMCGKFIGRMQWFLVGTSDGFIYVYTYVTKKIEKITSFQASTSSVASLAVHPTQPYALSTSGDGQMKLWSWDVKGSDWECTQTYEEKHSSSICQPAFNPTDDAKSFVSVSDNLKIKVWSMDSPKSNYTLFGHSDAVTFFCEDSEAVTCLDFFTLADKQYLVSGSFDGSVRIWDLQKRACVHTTEALMSPVRCVISLPGRPYLLICLKDGTVHLWSCVNFRSDRVLNFCVCEGIRCVHLLGLDRVMIQHIGGTYDWDDTVSIMDIDSVVKPAAIKGTNDPEEDMDNFSKEKENITDAIISYHCLDNDFIILDAHPTETWILRRSFYSVDIWNVVTKEREDIIDVEDVRCGKFIGRMQWFLVGSSDGFIHVYSYETKEIRKITSFRASTTSYVKLMAIHPTQPYVLSSAKDRQMKLWNWDAKDSEWECTQTYEDEHSRSICELKFNPKDTTSFASASRDHTVKVWSLDSPKSNYTLFGHLSPVNCLNFFTRGDKEYLVSGSSDRTVRIWDLQKSACVHTTEAPSPVLSVKSLPERPYLLLGLKDGTVHLWRSDRFRSERIFNFGPRGAIDGIHLLGSGRIAIEHKGDSCTVSIMDIDNIVKQDAIKGSNEPNEDMDNFSEEQDNVIDAVNLYATSEAQREATHIFEEAKEHSPDAQHADSDTETQNHTEASVLSQLSAHTQGQEEQLPR